MVVVQRINLQVAFAFAFVDMVERGQGGSIWKSHKVRLTHSTISTTAPQPDEQTKTDDHTSLEVVFIPGVQFESSQAKWFERARV